MTLARYVVHLYAYPIGVFKQHRVVTRCKLGSVLRRMHNPCIGFVGNERVDSIDVFTLAGAKAEMMEPGVVLIESLRTLIRRGATHENPGTAADAIDYFLTPDERLHSKEVTQPFPERNATRGIVDRKLDVGNPVDFYRQSATFSYQICFPP